MRKRIRALLLLFVVLTILPTPSAISEEKYYDVTMSVSVSSTFKLSADSVPVDFGVIDPGKTVELYPDRYFNEVKCGSNNGRTWYLKANCGDLVGPNAAIAKSHLKIKVYWASGSGYYSTDWIPFGDAAVLVYTSGAMENEGKDVRVQFKYLLEPPAGVPAGSYTAIITYTMTEAQ